MSEIWNLSAICRCCHSDGQLKSLKQSYVVNNDVEIYSSMLRDTFEIVIQPPSVTSDISYAICEKCINDLRQAALFKKQVLICESKFAEYCKNEEFPYDVKMEVDSINGEDAGNDFDDVKFDDDIEDKNIALEELKLKEEYKTEVKDGITDVKQEDDAENQNAESMDTKRLEAKDRKPKKNTKSQSSSQLNDVFSQYIAKTGNTYSCRKCLTNFKTTRTIKNHILHKHKGQLYKCRICNKEFQRLTDKLLHMVTHDPNHPNICTYCGKVYPTKHALKSHVNSHHTKTTIFECDQCKKQFLHKKSLLHHIKVFHLRLPKPLICDICGHSFNDSTNLKKHIQTVHDKLRLYKCQLCVKDFTAKKHLVVHIRRAHTNEKPYVCDICEDAFVCSTELTKHKAKVHEGKITTYNCKQCHIQFNSRGELVRHSKSHAGSKPLICHICNRDFSCKYSLRRHIASHSGEKKFQCNICLKKFIQKGGLNRHIGRLHSDKAMVEKEKCDICKKHVRDIEKHIAAHNVKPFGCEFCPKRYPEKNALNRHIANIHFGRKAHACDICDHRYVHPRSLRNHRLRAHKISIDTEVDSKEDGVNIV